MHKDKEPVDPREDISATNAADRQQIQRDKEMNDLRWVLSDPRGRRFIWRLIGWCKVFESIFDPSGSKAFYNSGRQDIGHRVQLEVCEADQNRYYEMMTEAKGNK